MGCRGTPKATEPAARGSAIDQTSAIKGRYVLVKLKKADPFLRTERPILFLLRFDGVITRDTHSEENEGEEDVRRKTPIATLVSYHEI
jgi:hypothetical protein